MLNSHNIQTNSSQYGSGGTFLGGIGDLQRIASRAKAGQEMEPAELQEVGKNFEAIMLHQLLATMRQTIPKSDLFGDDSAREVYEDMFDQVIAEQAANSGQTGLGDMIVQELERIQQSRFQKPIAMQKAGEE